MSKGPRVPLYYDPKIDIDIAKIIDETPPRRRSQRLRELIRLGLLVENRAIPVPNIQEALSSPPQYPESAGVPSQPQQKQRKRVGIAPPDQQLR